MSERDSFERGSPTCVYVDLFIESGGWKMRSPAQSERSIRHGQGLFGEAEADSSLSHQPANT